MENKTEEELRGELRNLDSSIDLLTDISETEFGISGVFQLHGGKVAYDMSAQFSSKEIEKILLDAISNKADKIASEIEGIKITAEELKFLILQEKEISKIINSFMEDNVEQLLKEDSVIEISKHDLLKIHSLFSQTDFILKNNDNIKGLENFKKLRELMEDIYQEFLSPESYITSEILEFQKNSLKVLNSLTNSKIVETTFRYPVKRKKQTKGQ